MAKALAAKYTEEAKILPGEPMRCHLCHAGKPGPCAKKECPWPVAKRLHIVSRLQG